MKIDQVSKKWALLAHSNEILDVIEEALVTIANLLGSVGTQVPR